jgi:hypothetical protein
MDEVIFFGLMDRTFLFPQKKVNELQSSEKAIPITIGSNAALLQSSEKAIPITIGSNAALRRSQQGS